MTLRDHRDHEIAGATPRAREAFERALHSHLSWRSGVDAHLDQALLEAPSFTMAHVLRAYLSLCSRDVARVRQARSAHARAATLPTTHRERLHVAAIGAGLADDFEVFRALLQRLLDEYPRDVLALQVGHALDYVTGDIDGMGARIATVLPAWSKSVPGYHAVLAMEAFSLVEGARYRDAEERGLRSYCVEHIAVRGSQRWNLRGPRSAELNAGEACLTPEKPAGRGDEQHQGRCESQGGGEYKQHAQECNER